MLNRSGQPIVALRRQSFIVVSILLVAIFVSGACGSKPTEPARRFHLHGKIVSVSGSDHSVAIDHEAIPGFMDAMTMSYPIPNDKVLSALRPGDEINADLIVIGGAPHLENVRIIKQGTSK